jgi:ligand-binding SRPBCC domain-containing protein
MPSVEESIVIDRPAEDVFAFVTTPENDRLWSSTAVERVREEDEPIRVGSRIRAVDKFLGRRVESTLRVTEHDPSRRSAVRIEGPFKANGSYVLEPLERGTHFRWSMEAEAGLGGLYLGRITDRLVTMIFRRQLRRDLRQLKQVLER